ncbi:MAG TPA: MFS transporter [Pseudonocardiaceae bacterium]
MHPNARASALAVQQDIRATTARSWVLGLTAAAQFVLQLDFSIVNVALPTVQRELSFSASGLQWVVTGYALTYGALLLVAGRGGDQIGHRRAMLAGLTLFAISSLAGGLAVSAPMLVIARLVQGGSAALIAPAALALLVDAYQSPAARARALGIFQGSTAAGATAGIVLGGVLTEYLGWRSVLLVNPPVIAILVAIMLRRLPARDMDETRDSAVGAGAARRLDVAGAGLITAAIAALIFGLSEGQSRGFGNPEAIATLAAAVVLGVAFVFVERHALEPMLPTALLRNRPRAAALTVMFLLGAVVAGYVYFVSLYLQRVLGLSALMTGLALVPATGTVMVTSVFITRRLLPRLGIRWTLLTALVLIVGGQVWLAQISPHGNYLADVLGGILLTAAGMGLAFPTASFVVTSDVPAQQRGVAGGMLVTAQQVGSAVGLAVLAIVAAEHTEQTGSLTAGYGLSYLIGAGMALLAIVASFGCLHANSRQGKL